MWLLPKKVKDIQVCEFPLQFYQDLKLESLLTGIPQKICKNLKETSKNFIRYKELPKCPSIRGLENLVTLKFYCLDFPFKIPQDGWGYFRTSQNGLFWNQWGNLRFTWLSLKSSHMDVTLFVQLLISLGHR
ncbi:unnamed protein product [Allacma fusca]|uniref:Uncharacterized protein n=1 Tax=Allacma fusca TaxID=39272 RepID=A0A8J2PM47_9HEXA|nr:unnamed protein product [Allacma fusca]